MIFMKTLLKIVLIILVFWIVLTLYVQREVVKKNVTYGKSTNVFKALIIYNPDPFYNLDEQLCKTFAKTLSKNKWHATVSTVTSAKKMNIKSYNLIVFCANTYNWSPDKPVKNFIKSTDKLKQKNVVAIALGSGSTKRAQRILEKLILDADANLIASKSFWSMKPNDDSKTNQSNIVIANRKVEEFVNDILNFFY